MSLFQQGALRHGMFALIGLALVLSAWAVRRIVVEEALKAGLALSGVTADFRVVALDFNSLVLRDVEIEHRGITSLLAQEIAFDYRLTEAFAGGVRGVEGLGVEAWARFDGRQVIMMGAPEPWKQGVRRSGSPMPNIDFDDLRVHIDTPLGEVILDADIAANRDRGWIIDANIVPARVAHMTSGQRPEQDIVPDTVPDVEETIGEGTAPTTGNGNGGYPSITIDEADILALLGPDSAEISARFIVTDITGASWSARELDTSLYLTGDMADPMDPTTLSLTGQMRVAGYGTALPRHRADALAARMAPTPAPWAAPALSPHLDALRATLADALTGVDVSAAADVRVLGDTWAFTLTQPLSASFLGDGRLVAGQADTPFVIDIKKKSFSLQNALIYLSTDRLTQATIDVSDVESARNDAGQRTFEMIGRASMSPWDVDGLAVAMEIAALRFAAVGENWTASAEGRAGAEGRRAGLAVSGLSTDFNIAIQAKDGRIRVTPRPGSVQGVRMAMGSILGVDVRDVSARLGEVRPGRAFLDAGATGIQAAARVADLELYAARRPVFGARLRAPSVELSFDTAADNGPRLDARLQGPRIDGLTQNNAIARIEARILNIQSQFTAPFTLSALFHALAISGDASPVEIADAAGEAEVRFAAGTLADGRLDLVRAELSDPRPVPRFEPLRVGFVGPLTGPVLQGRGWVKHAQTGRDLGDITVTADITGTSGQIEVLGANIAFVPGGFQPGDIMAQLGDVFPNANGVAAISGNVAWPAQMGNADGRLAVQAEPDLTLSARLLLDQFGFDADYGRVEGASGTVVFTDLLGLTTQGAQRVTIDKFNPGIPLKNGDVSFAMQGAERVVISTARFDVAGGQLVFEPIETTWRASERAGVARLIAADLNQAGSIFQSPTLRMEGGVSGVIPFLVDQRQVALQDARLRSDRSGRIRLRPGDDPVQGLSADPGLGVALRDLTYEQLTLSADGPLDGQLVVGLTVLGREASVNSAFTLDLQHWVRQDRPRGRTLGFGNTE